jgi:hypothetical protein
MPRFRIERTQPHTRVYFVEADSKDAAMDKYLDDSDEIEEDEEHSYHSDPSHVEIEEEPPAPTKRNYRVTARRVTDYEVMAASEQEACDLMVDGEAKEVNGETMEIRAVPLCADCGDQLTYRMAGGEPGDIQHAGEPRYCDTCDREVL